MAVESVMRRVLAVQLLAVGCAYTWTPARVSGTARVAVRAPPTSLPRARSLRCAAVRDDDLAESTGGGAARDADSSGSADVPTLAGGSVDDAMHDAFGDPAVPAGPVPTPEADLGVVHDELRAHLHARNPSKALRVLKGLKRRGITADRRAYVLGLVACDRLGAWEVAAELLNEAEANGVPPSERMYMQALQTSAAADRWQESIALLARLRDSRDINAYPYALAISACGRAGQWQHALSLHASMVEAGVAPTTKSYAALLGACGRAEDEAIKVDRVLELADEMREEHGLAFDSWCAMSVLRSLGARRDWRSALALIDELRAQDGAAAEARRGADDTGWGDEGEGEGEGFDDGGAVRGVFDEEAAAESGGGAPPEGTSAPPTPTPVSEAEAAAEESRARVLAAMAAEMGEGAPPPAAAAGGGAEGRSTGREAARTRDGAPETDLDADDDEHAADGADGAERAPRAAEAGGRAAERSSPPTERPSPPAETALNGLVYTAAMGVCAKAGRVREAEKLLRTMRKDGLRPTRVTYATLIHACAGAAEWRKALTVLEEMSAMGPDSEPNLHAYGGALRACAKAREYKEVLRLFGRIKARGLTPNAFCYHQAILACEHAGSVRQALGLLEEMEAAGVSANIYTYTAAVQVCATKGAFRRALELVDTMCAKGPKPTTVTFNVLLRGAIAADQLDTASKVLQSMPKLGAQPDAYSYSMVINGYAKIGEVDEALGWLKKMPKQLLSNMTYHGAIAALCDAGLTQDALSLLDLMRKQGLEPAPKTMQLLLDQYGAAGALAD